MRPRPRGLIEVSVRSSTLLPQRRPTGRKCDRFTHRGPVTKIVFLVPGRVAWKGGIGKFGTSGRGSNRLVNVRQHAMVKLSEHLQERRTVPRETSNGRGTRPRRSRASHKLACFASTDTARVEFACAQAGRATPVRQESRVNRPARSMS